MKIREKIMLDRAGYEEHGPINIAIFGDSVSHAAFNGYQDYERVYWNVLKRKLYAVRNYVPINTICAAVGGTSANASLPRLDSQILKHEPDLLIVCFGLNDVNGELDAIEPTISAAARHLCESGRIAIISFHSLEDRIVKQTYRKLSTGCTCPRDFPVCVCGNKPSIKELTKKPVLPSEEELNFNPRSRSAKLRIAEKL